MKNSDPGQARMTYNMQNICCVFAHPDDEAFGPAGTIATLSQTNNVYVVCATRGEAGYNTAPGRAGKEELGRQRECELLASAEILGIKKVFFLDFKDGALCNNLYHALAEKIENILEKIKPKILITYEPRGISGHLDHVAVSMVTSFVFEKLKTIKEIWYYCISNQYREKIPDYFIYFPPGYKKSEINKVIDITSVWPTKVAAMNAHASQRHDAQRILTRLSTLPKNEHFLVKKRLTK